MTLDTDPPLGGTRRDSAVAIAKGFIGAIPGVGSIFAEVVGQLIPEQRIERLEAYARFLAARLSHLADEDVRARLRIPKNIDVFEEGAFQSARALSDERKEYIANLVANSISGEEKDRLEAKRLLNLLRDVDDAQIVILASHHVKFSHDEAFHERHRAILEPIAASMTSDESEIDAETIQDAADAHLIRLGLLKPRFKRPRKGDLPEFDDKTGMLKASGTDLTRLGRLFLRQIGLTTLDY